MSAPTAYDRLSSAYADRFFGELADKPFDRVMLRWLVERSPGGRICDLGCGPGQVAVHLRTLGAETLGIDAGAGMIAEASRRTPGIEFHVGDMFALDWPTGAFASIAAFYSIVHLDRSQLPVALGETLRVLAPGGWLLLAFHVGEGSIRIERMLDQDLALDFTLFDMGEIASPLAAAGFEAAEAIERAPYPTEGATCRGYVWARKPAVAAGGRS